ncbi:hypothetical protein GQ53DRAFT_753702 [Thozetella sp. PMI_491]|nr:hypothetical protein GQ53DRAFT_753702 [Thozetella sp. PMI_491]
MDIATCIFLHNEIAAIHAASPYLHPDCHLRRNFFSAFGDEAIALRSRLHGDLVTFLEGTDYFIYQLTTSTAAVTSSPGNLVESAARKENRVVRNPSLTPYLRFPHPDHLVAYAHFPIADDPVPNCLASDVVLLYHGIGDTQWGGLFMDLGSGSVHWAALDSSHWPLPRPGAWVPLADALQHYLAAWRAGTYRLAPEPEAPEEPEGCILTQPFAEADLQAALHEWSRLLSAVESRLPSEIRDAWDLDEDGRFLLSREDLEDQETLYGTFLLPPEDVDEDEEQRWSPSFAFQFLCKARAPRDRALRIAPGIGCFSLERMHELLEADDAERRMEACESRMLEWSERPVLLFPGTGDGQDRVRQWRDREIPNMHRDTLLNDTPGLYIMPRYNGRQDEVVFILPQPAEASGVTSNDSVFAHSTACPYFATHNPKLVSILQCWRKLNESGIVHVGVHGVEGELNEVWNRAAQTPEGRLAFNIGRCS